MRSKRLFIPFVLLAGVMYLSITVYQTETEKRKIKVDLIELSKIKYGLFSIDEWKKILADLIAKKIEEFDLEGADRPEMRRKISGLLQVAINDLKAAFHEENSKKPFGFVREIGVDVFGIFDDMEKQIPSFTEKIIDFMNDPKNRAAIRGYIVEKLNAYADNTFSKIDYSTHDKIISEYSFENRAVALSGLKSRIDQLDGKNRPYQIGLIAFGILTSLFLLFSKRITKNEYLLLIVISFLFLMTGLLLPMIEIDARISEMSFTLLGESVIFQDQVLYYKSKSILEVVRLMMTQSRLDLIFVGLLVFTFSVLFPVIKLLSSTLYLKSERFDLNRFVQFMIFKTGKWSMADVMVIAIFMAYIGFSGIITEQLKQLESITQNIDILTTNKSNLLTGFFTFTSFAILSLLTSHKMQYEFRKRRKELTSEVS